MLICKSHLMTFQRNTLPLTLRKGSTSMNVYHLVFPLPPPSSSESWTTSSVTFLTFASTWMTFWSQSRQKQNTCTTSTKCYNICNHLVLRSRKTNASSWRQQLSILDTSSPFEKKVKAIKEAPTPLSSNLFWAYSITITSFCQTLLPH